MADTLKTDILVIGGGSGGLSVAAGAAQLGADVVLAEGGKMGGDCLNYGCVPSKSLIAAAKHAHARSKGAEFGVAPVKAEIDFAAVHDHVHDVIAGIAPHDSVERFEGLGVRVLPYYAKFISPTAVQVRDTIVEARRIVVATGSRATAPPIPGLMETPYLTNETIFKLTEAPRRLLIIGGGPIGVEMAQAHRRLGSEVVVLDAVGILNREDPELSSVVLSHLEAEGIDLRPNAKITKIHCAIEDGCEEIVIELESGETVNGSHLLVAAGRAPNLEWLDLDAGGVDYDRTGVKVDAGLRSTSNRKVYAIGDAAGGMQFTHVAGYHAGVVIRSALFRLPAKARMDHIPRVTYTDPEIAQVGLTEAEAEAAHGANATVLRWSFAENDRARAERQTDGLIKVMTGKGGRILGASIVGPQAGELIQPWALALSEKMKIGAMANYVAPYPTLGEVSKRAAGSYYTPKLFSDRTKAIVRFLAKLG